MKLDINEVSFMKDALGSVNIKASDSVFVASLITKVDKEFDRLLKLEEKKTNVA